MAAPNASSVAPKLWALPESITQRLGRDAGPQRSMLEEGHLLIILHALPSLEETRRRHVLFWRQPNGEWRSTAEGKGLVALQNLLASYEGSLVALESLEDKACTAAEYHEILEHIAPVLRATRGLHRALQQARELVRSDRDLINCRDQSAGLERTAELVLQDAQFGLNYIMAKQAESQAADARLTAATAHRLNLLAAFFLPLTAVSSLLGVNIRSGIPDTPMMFAAVVLVGVMMGLVLMAIVGKRK